MGWWQTRKDKQILQRCERELHKAATQIVTAINAGNEDGSIKAYLQRVGEESGGGTLAQETEQALAQVLNAANGYLQKTMDIEATGKKFYLALRILAYMTYIMDVQNADSALKDKWFAEYVTEFLHSRNQEKTHLRIRKTTLELPGPYMGRDMSFLLDCEIKRSEGKLEVGPLFPLLTEIVEFCSTQRQLKVYQECELQSSR